MAVRSRRGKSSDTVAYSENAVRSNNGIVEYCRICNACLSGSTAGILGLTGLQGFVFFFLNVFILWVRFKVAQWVQGMFFVGHCLHISAMACNMGLCFYSCWSYSKQGSSGRSTFSVGRLSSLVGSSVDSLYPFMLDCKCWVNRNY